MSFPFTINSHEYTNTGASTSYDFAGYGWLQALPNLIVDIVAVAVASDGLTATSTTSLAIATGAKTFTIQTGKSLSNGSYFIAVSAADPTNYMHGQITTYTSATGALITDIDDIGGSGTHADWEIAISGTQGPAGTSGTNGTFMPIAAAGGTVDAITANFTPDITLTDLMGCAVVSAGENTSTTPTFAPDGLTARTITTRGGGALVAGDIGPAGYVMLLEYNLANTRWELMNPAVDTATLGGIINAASAKTTPVDADFFGLMDSAASNVLKKLSWANVKATFVATVNTWTKAQRGAFVALTDAATVTIDLSLANLYKLLIGGNRTLGVPTNIVEGQQGVIKIRQDTTGSRTLAYAWVWQWASGSAGVLSTPGCSSDQLVYSVDVYATSTVTITIATPGVVTWNAHGLDNGQPIQLTTTGALPTGLTASTTYWVTNQSTNSFSLSTTLANAAAGTKIATSGSQSGVHTMVACSIALALNKAYA